MIESGLNAKSILGNLHDEEGRYNVYSQKLISTFPEAYKQRHEAG